MQNENALFDQFVQYCSCVPRNSSAFTKALTIHSMRYDIEYILIQSSEVVLYRVQGNNIFTNNVIT